MFLDLLILAAGLLTILAGANIFTNGIEWLGKRLNLSEGAVGSVLAAVGTAMPETMVPVIAILFGPGGNAHEVGIGAILGAPFMLSTLAFGVVGVSKMVYCRCQDDKSIDCKHSILMRDLKFFILFYSIAVAAAFIPSYTLKVPVALSLVAGYIYYVKKTLRDGDDLSEADLPPPYLLAEEPPAAPGRNPCPNRLQPGFNCGRGELLRRRPGRAGYQHHGPGPDPVPDHNAGCHRTAGEIQQYHLG